VISLVDMKSQLRARLLVLLILGVVACSSSSDDTSTSDFCKQGCVATIAAKCSNGPADQATCESDCNGLQTSACGSQYKAVQSCSQGKAVTCDASGNPTVSGCDSELLAFVACLNK
jgi:hypothetical protein